MQMTPIESSMFSHIGYADGTLAVRYRSGGKLFHHEGVPVDVWEALLAAESFGKAFHALVKRAYPGVEVKEPPADMPVAPIPEAEP